LTLGAAFAFLTAAFAFLTAVFSFLTAAFAFLTAAFPFLTRRRCGAGGLRPAVPVLRLRAEHRIASLVRPFGLPSRPARSAPKGRRPPHLRVGCERWYGRPHSDTAALKAAIAAHKPLDTP